MLEANGVLRVLAFSVLLTFTASKDIPIASSLSLSVLAGDDPCLGGTAGDLSECSAGLLQRTSGGLRAVKPLEATSTRQTPATSSHGDTRGVQSEEPATPASELQMERSRKRGEQDKTAAATSLLADIRHLVTQVKMSGKTAPEVKHLADEYAQLLEAQAVPSLSAGYREHQDLLASHAKSFSRCDNDLSARMETEQQLRQMYEGWRRMHGDCRAHEERLQKELASCSHRLKNTESRKQAACMIMNTSVPISTSHNDASLVQMKRQCQDATQSYVDQWSICAEGTRFYDTKRSECDSVQQSMETANCTRASQVSGICDMYDLCRAGMSLAYTSAKEAARGWERYHQAEWLAVVMVRCFAENLGNKAENSSALLGELEKCEQLVTNTTLFDLEYPDVPLPQPCTAVNDSPCVTRLPAQPQPRRAGTPMAALASAVAADAQNEKLPMAVSFVQEGIEHAGTFPGEVHEALSRPQSPLIFSLASITILVVLARCMVQSKEQSKDFADEPEVKENCNVDKWCTNGSDVLTATGPPHSTHLLLYSGRWLCPELLVPQNSRCTITVPAVSNVQLDSAPTIFLVVDKMGQPLFKASASRSIEKIDPAAVGNIVETLSIARQDGTTLATCRWTVPEATSGRKPEAKIFQRDGILFGVMDRTNPKASWLKRLLRSAPPSSNSNFMFTSASPGAWQLQLQGNAGERRFSFVDGSGATMAVVELGQHPAAGQGGQTANRLEESSQHRPTSNHPGPGQEFYRIEAGSDKDVDLGLVTLVLLTIDRMTGS